MHFNVSEVLQNVGYIFQLHPVELNVLAGGKVAKSPVILFCNQCEFPHLSTGYQSIRNTHPKHVCVTLVIEPVL